MRNALGAALLVMAAALPSSAMAEDEQAPEPPRIYECTGADGAVVYQDDPCPAPPPVPAKPSAKPSPRAKPAATAAKRTAPHPVPAPSPAAPPPRAAKRPGDDEWARIAAINARPGGGSKEMASPERVWDTFVRALRAGDRSGAVRCLGPGSTSGMEALSPEELQARGNAYSALVLKNNVGPQRVAGAARRNGRVTWIFFERAPGGEWRIASM